MIVKVPQIGFDRFIHLDWVAAALLVRAGKAAPGEINRKLGAAGLGKEALAKTRTKLNALVLEPRTNLVDFIDRGVELFSDVETPEKVAPFVWGAALAVYPYFGRVAEFTGRLTTIQGDCSVSEIHRRISEIYGDREITKRATQAVLQSQANWGVIERFEKDRRLRRVKIIRITNKRSSAWLIEAAIRFHGKAIALSLLPSLPVLYPFALGQSLSHLIASDSTLELRTEGSNTNLVALRKIS